MPVRVNEHPEDIRAAIRKTGITFEELGRRTNVAGNTLRKSLRVPCPKGNRVIARYLGRPLSDLWPEWYDADGNRIPLRGWKSNNRRGDGH